MARSDDGCKKFREITMQEIELNISQKDWLIILIIGITFSLLMTSIVYFLLDYNLTDGLVFGAILGVSIVFYSMVFIIYLNKNILPKLSHKYWFILAALFSFLSGFFGTYTTYLLAKLFNILMLVKFENNLFLFALMLGFLTNIIGSLLYQFVRMSNQKEYHQKMLIQSRLKSLETQLNPHFLFNAINSLAELIHHDSNKADTALTQLSKFLRASMQEQTLLSIADEIENLKRYLDLENIRFQDKIVLKLSCDDALQKIKIPKFSIQLLAENAIKHSFRSDCDYFEIYLHIQKKQNKLYITLSNSGKEVTSSNYGIGLNNLNERLKLLCDGSVSLIDPKSSKYQIMIGRCDENTTC